VFLRGRVAYELIRELALGVADDMELATRYETKVPAVQAFRERYAVDIQRVREELRNDGEPDLAALWITSKAKRIAEYQSDVERINDALELELDKGLLRVKHAALHSVAEELAQLPVRSAAPQIDENVIHYSIVGVTTTDLGDALS
jgi:hypothetical protein